MYQKFKEIELIYEIEILLSLVLMMSSSARMSSFFYILNSSPFLSFDNLFYWIYLKFAMVEVFNDKEMWNKKVCEIEMKYIVEVIKG